MSGYFVWDIDPVIISFYGFPVRWYGLFFAVALIFGLYFMREVFEKEKKNIKDLETLFTYVIIGIIIGARLVHCLIYEPGYYLDNPLEIIKIWKGGLASHGGGAGLFIAVIIFYKRKKDYILMWLADNLTVPVLVGGFFIRIGNFFNSEIVGKKASVPWAVIFKRVDLVPRHPSQIYEAVLYLFLAIVFLYLHSKKKIISKTGLITGLMLVSVFTGRILLEFYKIPQESYNTGMVLNTGQILSIPLIIAGLLIILLRKRIKF